LALFVCFPDPLTFADSSSAVVFQEERGWSPGIGGLPFLGVFTGMLFVSRRHLLAKASHEAHQGVLYTIFFENKRYVRVADKLGVQPPPEERLPSSIFGGFCLVVGLALFAGVCGPNIVGFAFFPRSLLTRE
jgi:hypothetical protein